MDREREPGWPNLLEQRHSRDNSEGHWNARDMVRHCETGAKTKNERNDAERGKAQYEGVPTQFNGANNEKSQKGNAKVEPVSWTTPRTNCPPTP